MPPRYAYWTILIDDTPTAFRAREREELLPTLAQLQRKNTNVTMKWFARGQLWASREAEHADFQQKKEAAAAPRDRRADRDAGVERRGSDWRPGGTHKDPRDRFKKRNRPERAWSEKDPATQRDRDKLAGPPRGDRPAHRSSFDPRKSGGGWRDKPAGPPRGDRPWAGRPAGEKRPWSGKPPSGEKRPWSGKPRERKPWESKPAGAAPPPSDRPWQRKPTGPRAQRKPWVPQPERKPWENKPAGGPPRGDRPVSGKPAGGERRPWQNRPGDSDARRPGPSGPGEKRPWTPRPPSGEKRPWSAKPPAAGGQRPWSGKPREPRRGSPGSSSSEGGRDPNRTPFTPRGSGEPPRKRRDDQD